MELHNLIEDEVVYTINKLLKEIEDDICTCDRCKLDMAAIALNNLKPKYVVTEKGSLYGKLDILDYQFDVDLIKEVTKAIQTVGESPHHE